MGISGQVVPTYKVMEEAIRTNKKLGHENLGSLSYTHGFLPPTEPLDALPSSHRAWDEVAAEFPSLLRTVTVRRILNDLPLLSVDTLPDKYLVRASCIISIMAHLYWYCEPNEPENGLPIAIQKPWEDLTHRLDRIAPHLSFIDLNTHNWFLIDPSLEQAYCVENFGMSIAMTGNEDERRFQMTPVEMLYLFSPLMQTTIDAQRAVLEDDVDTLMNCLVFMQEKINYLSYKTFMKANPNPYSDHYINPVVWGKTAAPFAAPFTSVPGPSGTAVPSFTMLDIFFGRQTYTTSIGHETLRTRDWFPKHWRDWLDAVEEISIPDYVHNRQHETLLGVFNETRASYMGENGILHRHRMKAYGFLDLSFKAGRVKTLGGTTGEYSARVWDQMADELDESRLERYGHYPEAEHFATVKHVEALRTDSKYSVHHIVLDVSGTGLRYEAGDRCGILPENTDDLIEKTLRILGATGTEQVVLNRAWRKHVLLRAGFATTQHLDLRDLLRFGRIRPVERDVAMRLYYLTKNERLRHIIDQWAVDQWELWDLLAMLSEHGYNPKRLWKAMLGDHDHICRIIVPERWRVYSISSVMPEPNAFSAEEIHLTVSGLRYTTPDTDYSNPEEREGTSSSFLSRLITDTTTHNRPIPIKVIHPPRFSLPDDPNCPIIMFAGGTGIAPMRGLLSERIRSASEGENWLFFGTRTRKDFYYQEEFEKIVAKDQLNLRVAFSRDDLTLQFNPDEARFEFLEGTRHRIDKGIRELTSTLKDLITSRKNGGQGAYIYICGRTEFANTVIDTLKDVFAFYHDHPEQGLYHLVGEERLLMEIFTTYDGAHFGADKRRLKVSDLILHNNDENGYWLMVNGRVYDMNEFGHIHPGGLKIIQSYSGMDATFAYQQIGHHINPEVDSMLGMYEIGVINTPEFGQHWGVAVSPTGLQYISLREAYQACVDLAFIVVEMENAILNDFRTLDEPMTDIENEDTVLLSPFKLQQIGLAHHRLLNDYLPQVLGESLTTLWSIMLGVFNQKNLEASWMPQSIEHVQSSAVAQGVQSFSPRLNELLQKGISIDEAVCQHLMKEDLRLIHDIKHVLRNILLILEQYETSSMTDQNYANSIIVTLTRFPELIAQYYHRFVTVVDS